VRFPSSEDAIGPGDVGGNKVIIGKANSGKINSTPRFCYFIITIS
jgi:hypothetical protein